MRRCSRCLYDDTIKGLSFDSAGMCNYCQWHDSMELEYPTGAAGRQRLEALAAEIRKRGRGKPFDVIVGVSGGCDSSYTLYLAKDLGLRPLAVHFDNTWNSTVAVENISTMLKYFDVELYTYVVDNKEYDDLYRSFFKAGVPDLEATTDIGFVATLYRAAEEYNIEYILEGHSFRTEGTSPLSWLYFDGKYIESVHKQFGTVPMKTYPNLDFVSFLKWVALKKLKKLRPLYYVNYVKSDAIKFLESNFGWKWYSGHHLENRFTAFYHSYFMPKRFNIDGRVVGYSALVRSGQMKREEALSLLSIPPPFDPELVEMVKKRLGFSDSEFEILMTMPKHSYKEFETYKDLFRRIRWFLWLLCKFDRIPKSFYVKYTAPD